MAASISAWRVRRFFVSRSPKVCSVTAPVSRAILTVILQSCKSALLQLYEGSRRRGQCTAHRLCRGHPGPLACRRVCYRASLQAAPSRACGDWLPADSAGPAQARQCWLSVRPLLHRRTTLSRRRRTTSCDAIAWTGSRPADGDRVRHGDRALALRLSLRLLLGAAPPRFRLPLVLGDGDSCRQLSGPLDGARNRRLARSPAWDVHAPLAGR